MESQETGASNAMHDIQSLVSSVNRDFLIRRNGDQVKVENLKGKKLGLYFSASWCGPCQRFTPKLVEVYNELVPVSGFEVVFVSGDVGEESFNAYFQKMPWLAIPFSDSDTRERLNSLFSVEGIPCLVILDENGKVLTNEGVENIQEYGAEVYPFAPDRIKELKEREEEAKTNQSLKSILVSPSRDYVITADEKKVPVAELEGKTVGLYFCLFSYSGCADFTKKLVEVYKKLKEDGENFEIVMIPLDVGDDDDDQQSFKQGFKGLPWFSLPNRDKSCEKLVRYFDLSTLPTVVIIGTDGKTRHPNVAETIEEHGSNAYPFTPEKFAELQEIEKAKREAQTLESILTSQDCNYVIGQNGVKVLVADLVGKTVLLYFSAHWCPPCRAFLPKLVDAYHKIKAKDDAFEVIFISSDRDQTSFEEFFSTMPWLALPFGDERKKSLSRLFKVKGIPMVVAIGPTGKTVSTEARNLIMRHGADAYPFTAERSNEIETEYEKMAKGWPEKLKHPLHEEHELSLTKVEDYSCDACLEYGYLWSFYCEECDFSLHPKCALDDKEIKGDGEKDAEDKSSKEGWICDGEVCHKA